MPVEWPPFSAGTRKAVLRGLVLTRLRADGASAASIESRQEPFDLLAEPWPRTPHMRRLERELDHGTLDARLVD